MIHPAQHGVEVWLCVEPVDIRKLTTGLATLVPDTLSMDPFSSQLFVFTNRRRTQCRILYWERCGFVLWHKRLERARFAWPRHGDPWTAAPGKGTGLFGEARRDHDRGQSRLEPRLCRTASLCSCVVMLVWYYCQLRIAVPNARNTSGANQR